VTKPSVSIFYPCYNDWGTIGSMLMLTQATVRHLGIDYDITIVDDGSGEHTQAILDEIVANYPNVTVLRHDKNRGYGGALRSGFTSGSREWLFYTDGDAQYDVRELENLVSAAGPDIDVVQGYKITRHDPLHRRVIGRVYHWIVKIAFGLKLRDVDCDFRLIRRHVFDKITLVHDSGVICAEMMTKIQRAGFRVVEVPVHHFERHHGKSQFFNFPRIARVAWNLTGLWIRLIMLQRDV
jgi:glycosyltransferase involved in cell wall biosynthesis